MKKNIMILMLIFISIFIMIFYLFNNKKDEFLREKEELKGNYILQEENQNNLSIDNGIEVVNFHTTQRCASCELLGKNSLKTIKSKFTEEYKNREIIFKSININLPKNKEMTEKYKATGSSLFLNVRINGKDNIKEDTNVWRYVFNEDQFLNYLEAEIRNLLN